MARGRPKARFVFVAFFVLAFLSLACWSFASPLSAAPDEQSHVIRADALDHGQLGHPTTRSSKILVTVRVPKSINESKFWLRCWQFQWKVPASCSPHWSTSLTEVPTTIHVGHYPPLYYAVVGLPSLVTQQRSGIYAMRLVSDLISALMLALAAYAIARWSRRRTIVAGVFASLTPIALFLSSAVNPSGFEIASAICLWTAATIFMLDHPSDPPTGLVVVLCASATVLTLIRGLSPLWVALVALTLVAALGPRHLSDLVRARRDVRRGVLTVAVASVLAVIWITTQGALNLLPSHVKVPASASTLTTLRLVSDHVLSWLHETIGVLGWLDTPLPSGLYLLWYAILAVLVVAGFARGERRPRVVLAGLAVLAIIVPIVLVANKAHVQGIVWQGRDGMPLTVGVIILAAALCGRAAETRLAELWGASVVVVLTSVLAMIAFFTNLRRYAVGLHGPRSFFIHDLGWSPPTGSFLTLALYGLVTTFIAALTTWWIWTSKGPLDVAVGSAVLEPARELSRRSSLAQRHPLGASRRARPTRPK